MLTIVGREDNYEAITHMCAFVLTAKDPVQAVLPAMKPTRFVTISWAVAEAVDGKCSCSAQPGNPKRGLVVAGRHRSGRAHGPLAAFCAWLQGAHRGAHVCCCGGVIWCGQQAGACVYAECRRSVVCFAAAASSLAHELGEQRVAGAAAAPP